MLSRIELLFSRVFGKCLLNSHFDLVHSDFFLFLILILVFLSLILVGLFKRGMPPHGTRAYFFFTIFVAFISRADTAECMDNHDAPQVPAAPPAGPADQLRNAVLEVVNEPAGPLELPTVKRGVESFFQHYTSGRTPSQKNLQNWIWTEFSLDQSQADEREHILATIEQIKTQYPQDSLSPAQARDLLYNRVNTWLDAMGRENLNLRKTGFPSLG